MLSDSRKHFIRNVVRVPKYNDRWFNFMENIIEKCKVECDHDRPGDSIYFVKECRRHGVHISNEITFLMCYYYKEKTKSLYRELPVEVRI